MFKVEPVFEQLRNLQNNSLQANTGSSSRNAGLGPNHGHVEDIQDEIVEFQTFAPGAAKNEKKQGQGEPAGSKRRLKLEQSFGAVASTADIINHLSPIHSLSPPMTRENQLHNKIMTMITEKTQAE